MQVLHAVLYSFLIVFTRRICQTIKSFFEFAIISYILMTLISDSGVRLLGEIPVGGGGVKEVNFSIYIKPILFPVL